MSNELLLYLITRIDSLKSYMGFVFAIWIISVASIIVIYSMLIVNKDLFEKELKIVEPIKTKLLSFFPVVIILILIDIVVPDKKDMIMIYAGSNILNVIENPETKKVVGKSADAFEKYLDDYLKEEQK